MAHSSVTIISAATDVIVVDAARGGVGPRAPAPMLVPPPPTPTSTSRARTRSWLSAASVAAVCSSRRGRRSNEAAAAGAAGSAGVATPSPRAARQSAAAGRRPGPVARGAPAGGGVATPRYAAHGVVPGPGSGRAAHAVSGRRTSAGGYQSIVVRVLARIDSISWPKVFVRNAYHKLYS